MVRILNQIIQNAVQKHHWPNFDLIEEVNENIQFKKYIFSILEELLNDMVVKN